MENKLNGFTRKEQAEYLRLSLNLAGINCDNTICELIIVTMEELQKKGEKFSLSDALRIEREVFGRNTKRKVSAEKSESDGK